MEIPAGHWWWGSGKLLDDPLPQWNQKAWNMDKSLYLYRITDRSDMTMTLGQRLLESANLWWWQMKDFHSKTERGNFGKELQRAKINCLCGCNRAWTDQSLSRYQKCKKHIRDQMKFWTILKEQEYKRQGNQTFTVKQRKDQGDKTWIGSKRKIIW